MDKSLYAVAIMALTAMLLALPADAVSAQAPTGGTSPDGSSGGSSSSAPAPAVVLDPPVIVTGGGVVVRMRPTALLGRTVNFHGRTTPRNAGQTVVVERYDTIAARWRAVATAQVGPGGGFLARWRANQEGHVALRAVVGDGLATSARRHHRRPLPVSSTTAQMTVYSPARATYFGPGFYGKRTACGQVMSKSLVGVANRTLPCGTLVDVNYASRDIIVPVVDRGPYANGADWDLTAAAAAAIGMSETETIGTIALGFGPSPAPASSSPSGSPHPGGGPAGGTSAAG